MVFTIFQSRHLILIPILVGVLFSIGRSDQGDKEKSSILVKGVAGYRERFFLQLALPGNGGGGKVTLARPAGSR